MGDETLKGQILENFIEKNVGKKFAQPIERDPGMVEKIKTPTGWERLEKVPEGVIEKSKTKKAKRVWKVGKEIAGEYYNYRIIKGRDGVLRGYRKKKSSKKGKGNLRAQKKRYKLRRK